MSAAEGAATIRVALADLPRDSLRFFGEWFGGRRDNVHTVVGVASDDDVLRLEFDEGETLTVWNPKGITATQATLLIEDATRLRWEWFYYGRPRTPENLYWIEYVRGEDGQIRVTDTFVAIVPEIVHSPDESAPAVEMISFVAE